MQKVTPFLSSDGHAEKAARFYVSLLADSRIDRVIHSPIETQGGPPGSVLLVEFTLAGMQYLALNIPGFTLTEAVLFQILCADQRKSIAVVGTYSRWGGRSRLRLAERPLGVSGKSPRSG